MPQISLLQRHARLSEDNFIQKEPVMYTALYRSHRPETFNEVLGQEHIIKILKNQIATGRVSHAYLICDTRGTGKTTTARILAKAVNCLSEGERPCGVCANCRAIKEGNFIDVIEIDAASNNGVENIRELRESVKYPPAVGRKKVYIIDEVHMLSSGAYNALLKTLEEPPEHVMFILATTEPQRLPATILSRCMRLDFRRVPQKVIADDMEAICSERGVQIQKDAVRLLASCADGSVRDGLSILDQVLAGGDKIIDRDKVLEYVGTTGEDFFIELTDLVLIKKTADALVLLNDVIQEGKDVKQIMKDWAAHYRNLLIAKFVSNAEDMLNMSSENLQRIREQSGRISMGEIDAAIRRLSKTINDARWSTNPRVLLELAIVAISSGEGNYSAPGTGQQIRRMPQSTESQSAAAAKIADVQPDTAKSRAEDKEKPASVTQTDISEHDTAAYKQADGDGRARQQAENTGMSPSERAVLWHEIFEEGDDQAGSFNLIRSGTTLDHVGEDTFTVATVSSFTKRFTEQKRHELEQLMSRRMGRPMRLICHLKEDKTDTPVEEDETARIAEEARNILGIDIEIE